MAGVVCAVCRLQQRVQLGQALDARDRHEVAASEAADLALHAALLMRARDAGLAEERVEAEVRAQCGEAVALDAVASGEHARHGRLEIVVADAPRHPAEPPEGDRVALEERLLALARAAPVQVVPSALSRAIPEGLLPAIERRLRDPELAAELRHRRAGLHLSQRQADLLLRVAAPGHGHLPPR